MKYSMLKHILLFLSLLIEVYFVYLQIIYVYVK